jgi:hypothetical protein
MKTENLIGFSVMRERIQPERTRIVRADRRRTGGRPGRQRRGGATLVPLIAWQQWGSDVKIVSRGTRRPITTRDITKSARGFGKLEIPLIAGREFTEVDSLAGRR